MPLRAPGTDDPQMRRFLAEIRRAQEKLDASILEAQALPDTEPSKALRISRYNALKREVDRTFRELAGETEVWARSGIPNYYSEGFTMAGSILDSGYDFTLPHREAIKVLSQDAYDDVATRLQQVSTGFSRRVDGMKSLEQLGTSKKLLIQTAGRGAVSEQLLTGNIDIRDAGRILRDQLWEGGVTIVDAGGRQWGMETYTRMLVRTKSAMAYNSGSLGKYAEEGVTRVRVFDGILDDAECAEANNQIWTMRFAQQNMLSHPNCRRAFAPVAGNGVVNKLTTKDAALAGVKVAGIVREALFLRRLAKSFVMDGGIIDLHEGWLLQKAIHIEVERWDTDRIAATVEQIERYLEDIIDPAARRIGVIEEIPAHVPDDWTHIRRRVRKSFVSAHDEADKLELALSEDVVTTRSHKIKEQFWSDEDHNLITRTLEKLKTEGVEVPNYDDALHSSLGRWVEILVDEFPESLEPVAQWLKAPSKSGSLQDWAVRNRFPLRDVFEELGRILRLVEEGDGLLPKNIPSLYFGTGEDALVMIGFTNAHFFENAHQANRLAWSRAGMPRHFQADQVRVADMDHVRQQWLDPLTFEGAKYETKSVINSADLENRLKSTFGTDKVVRVPGGANGSFLVVEVTDGSRFAVKHISGRISANRVQFLMGEHTGAQVLDELGLPNFKHKFVSTDDGDLFDIFPWVENSQNLTMDAVPDVPLESYRRLALFDLITAEGDANSGNYILVDLSPGKQVGRRNNILYSIDRERSFDDVFGTAVHNLDIGTSGTPYQAFRTNLMRWVFGTDTRIADYNNVSGSWLLKNLDQQFAWRMNIEPIVIHDNDVLRMLPGVDTIDELVGTFSITGTVGDLPLTAFRDPDLALAGEWNVYPGQFVHRFGWDHPVMYLDEAETALVNSILDGSLVDDLYDDLMDVFNGIPELFQNDVYSAANTPEEHARMLFDRFQERVRLLVNDGRLVRGGQITVDPDFAGTRTQLGQWANFITPDGEEFRGYVYRMYTDSDGTKNVVLLRGVDDFDHWTPNQRPPWYLSPDERVEFLARQMPGDLDDINPQLTVVKETDVLNQRTSTRLENPLGYVADIEPPTDITLGAADQFADTAAERIVRTPITDPIGNFIGYQDSVIEIEASAVRAVEVNGVLKSAQGAVDVATETFIEELASVPPEFRPTKIRFTSDVITTPSGRRAVGYFDPETREMTVSFRHAYNDQWVEGINEAVLRETIQHELGHAVDAGVVENMRFHVKTKITRDIIDHHGWHFEDAPYLSEEFYRDALESGEYRWGWTELEEHMSQYVYLRQGEEAPPLVVLIEERAELMVQLALEHRRKQVELFLEDAADEVPWARSALKALREGEDPSFELVADAWAETRRSSPRSTLVPPPGMDERTFYGLFHSEPVMAWIDDWMDVPGVDSIWGRPALLKAAPEMLEPIELGFSPAKLFDKVFKTMPEDGGGGFTVQVVTGDQPVEGWAVAIKSRQKIIEDIDPEDLPTPEEWAQILRDFSEENFDVLESGDWFVGAWFDEDDNRLFLDVSRILDDDVSAVEFAIDETQIAIFNLETYQEVYTDRFQELGLDAYLIERRHIPSLRGQRKVKGQEIPVVFAQGGEVTPNIFPSTDYKHAPMRLRDLPDDVQELLTSTYEGNFFQNSETGEWIDTSLDAVRGRLERVLRQAEIGYSDTEEGWALRRLLGELPDDPHAAREHDRFYVDWNTHFGFVSDETGIEMARIAGSAAAMSNGLDAGLNRVVAPFLARVVAEDRRLDPDDVDKIRRYLKELIDANKAKGRTALVKELEDQLRGVKVNVRIQDLEGYAGVMALRVFLKKDLNIGLQAPRGWTPFVRAFRIMTDGDDSYYGLFAVLDENLGDTKVRSFYNNIMDPKDVLQYHDFTADFHMGDAGVGGTGLNSTTKWNSPSKWGVALGFRSILGEAASQLWDAGWGPRVGADSIAELQEVIWAWWRRGKAHNLWGDLPKIVTP